MKVVELLQQMNIGSTSQSKDVIWYTLLLKPPPTRAPKREYNFIESKVRISIQQQMHAPPTQEKNYDSKEFEICNGGNYNCNPILRLLIFHGTRKDDAEKHCFLCKTIWVVNKITNDDIKIM